MNSGYRIPCRRCRCLLGVLLGTLGTAHAQYAPAPAPDSEPPSSDTSPGEASSETVAPADPRPPQDGPAPPSTPGGTAPDGPDDGPALSRPQRTASPRSNDLEPPEDVEAHGVSGPQHADTSPGARDTHAPHETDEAPDTSAQKRKHEKEPWEKDPKLRVRGFVRALWQLTDETDAAVHEFRVPTARLGLEWKQSRMLRAELEIDAAEDQGSTTAWSSLRDAYVQVQPVRQFRLRAGQFKKPFSRLELTPRRRLRLVERGISNHWVVEDLGYGDRDVGVETSGRFGEKIRLSYALGVFNGSGRNAREVDPNGTKDVAARLELAPTGWLSIGISGSHRSFDPEVFPGFPRGAAMGEADLEVKAGHLYALAEGSYGENPLSIDRAESWSGLLLTSYRVPLTTTWRLAVEPVLKGEVLKPEHHVRNSHIIDLAAGANLHVGRYFCLMAHAELTDPASGALPLWESSRRLLVQVSVDMR